MARSAIHPARGNPRAPKARNPNAMRLFDRIRSNNMTVAIIALASKTPTPSLLFHPYTSKLLFRAYADGLGGDGLQNARRHRAGRAAAAPPSMHMHHDVTGCLDSTSICIRDHPGQWRRRQQWQRGTLCGGEVGATFAEIVLRPRAPVWGAPDRLDVPVVRLASVPPDPL